MSFLEDIEYWNDPAVATRLRTLQTGVTEFAHEVERRIPRRSRIADLGTGAGDDAAYFAGHGHDVIGFDVSRPLIDMAAQRFADIDNLEFRVADIGEPLSVGGQSLDAIYARLSLHYFDHVTTARIFGELAWVLRPGGALFFACQSTDDPLYGRGTEIEPDVFELEGHVCHFFGADYCRELLEDNGFTDIEIGTGAQKLYGQPSAYVKCSATHP